MKTVFTAISSFQIAFQIQMNVAFFVVLRAVYCSKFGIKSLLSCCPYFKQKLKGGQDLEM